MNRATQNKKLRTGDIVTIIAVVGTILGGLFTL